MLSPCISEIRALSMQEKIIRFSSYTITCCQNKSIIVEKISLQKIYKLFFLNKLGGFKMSLFNQIHFHISVEYLISLELPNTGCFETTIYMGFAGKWDTTVAREWCSNLSFFNKVGTIINNMFRTLFSWKHEKKQRNALHKCDNVF